jgi:putative endonuclease
MVRTLDAAAHVLRRPAAKAQHLLTGERGEEAAYFHLRKLGYTIVARNWRSPKRRGELDLVGWHDGVLCFIEVKTRTSRGIVPAEASVDAEKQQDLRNVAREYLVRAKDVPSYRFDVVSVYFEDHKPMDVTVLGMRFGSDKQSRRTGVSCCSARSRSIPTLRSA